jgi:hypothetical protein
METRYASGTMILAPLAGFLVIRVALCAARHAIVAIGGIAVRSAELSCRRRSVGLGKLALYTAAVADWLASKL